MTAVFIVLTFAVTWSAWLLCRAFGTADLGGLFAFGGPVFLLGVFAPAIVALVLTARAEGRVGVSALVGRIGRWDVGVRWYAFAALYFAAIKLSAALIPRPVVRGDTPGSRDGAHPHTRSGRGGLARSLTCTSRIDSEPCRRLPAHFGSGGGLMRRFILIAIGVVVAGVLPCGAWAQERGRVAVEGTGGWAGFVDEATVNHGVIGGAARFYVTPRISVGPEVAYMIGPGSDRDVALTGNVTFDLLAHDRRRVIPYVVAGAGLFQHREQFFSGSFTSNEGAFTAGGGVRAFLNDRVYVAPEARVGWELHLRVAAVVGIMLHD